MTRPHVFTPDLVPVFRRIYEHADRVLGGLRGLRGARRPGGELPALAVPAPQDRRADDRRRSAAPAGPAASTFLRAALELTFFPELYAVRTEIGGDAWTGTELRRAPTGRRDPLARLPRALPAQPGRRRLPGRQLARAARCAATARTAGRRSSADQWAGRLIRGWTEGWMELARAGRRPARRGRARRRRPARPWSPTRPRCCSTSWPAPRWTRDPDRREIVVDTDNFPTDRYVLEGIAAERGLRAALDRDRPGRRRRRPSRWPPPSAADTALVLLSHVAYRSGLDRRRRGDHRDRARGRGADAVGPEPLGRLGAELELDAWGVDLAVGCTYKYLNGGPGSPAFGYVRRGLQDGLQPADPGLDGPARPVRDGAGLRAGARRPGRWSAAPRRSWPWSRCWPTWTCSRRPAVAAVRAKSACAHRLRPRAHRRLARPVRRRGGLAARRRSAAGATSRCQRPGLRAVLDELWARGVLPGLPRAGRHPDRAGAAEHAASPSSTGGCRCCARCWPMSWEPARRADRRNDGSSPAARAAATPASRDRTPTRGPRRAASRAGHPAPPVPVAAAVPAYLGTRTEEP